MRCRFKRCRKTGHRQTPCRVDRRRVIDTRVGRGMRTRGRAASANVHVIPRSCWRMVTPAARPTGTPSPASPPTGTPSARSQPNASLAAPPRRSSRPPWPPARNTKTTLTSSGSSPSSSSSSSSVTPVRSIRHANTATGSDESYDDKPHRSHTPTHSKVILCQTYGNALSLQFTRHSLVVYDPLSAYPCTTWKYRNRLQIFYFFLYGIFFYFDLISGPSTSGHVWPSGLYIVNLYCLHESQLK